MQVIVKVAFLATLGFYCLISGTVSAQFLDDPGLKGPFTVQSTEDDLRGKNYRSAMIHWPTEFGVFPAAIVTGGFTNSKEDMKWISTHLASHGFVVLSFTPSNRFGNTGVWQKGFLSALETIDRINVDGEHPLFQSIELSEPALLGYSMGGGGAFLTAQEVPEKVGPIVLLAPYLNDRTNVPIKSPSLIITGSRDSVAVPRRYGEPMFELIPEDTDKVYLKYRKFRHNVFTNRGKDEQHYKLAYYLTSFLHYYHKRDPRYSNIVLPPTNEAEIKRDWFESWEFFN